MMITVPFLLLSACQDLQSLDERVSKNVRAKQCEFIEPEIYHERPVDLGNGIVGSTFNAGTGIGTLHSWTATECKTGREISVIFERTDWTGESKLPPVPDRRGLQKSFVEQAKSLETVTLQKLTDLAEEKDIASRVTLDSDETCGCAAFYPNLLGEKYPALARDRMPAWSEL